MQEFYVVTTQKIVNPLDRATTERILRDLTRWHLHAPVAEDMLGCSNIWSEDLSEGQDYDGFRVVNPFRD